MDQLWPIITAVVVLVVIGVGLGRIFARRNDTQRLQSHFGPEYDHTVQTLGSEKKAQMDLVERQHHVSALDIKHLSPTAHDRYLADWVAAQSKFVDDPSQAIIDADHLITEVMIVRGYPVSDFEQRAADISVGYPALVSNYRAARVIALKNEQHQANTEELRQAMVYYHPLFEELLETKPVVV